MSLAADRYGLRCEGLAFHIIQSRPVPIGVLRVSVDH